MSQKPKLTDQGEIMHRQAGFSLLEVMIAGVVTALGLAGTAALLLTSLAQTSAAQDRTMAGMLARHGADLLRLSATPAAVTAPTGPAPESCVSPGACSPAGFAAHNRRHWDRLVALHLPEGHGLICNDASPRDGSLDAPACDGSGPLVIKLFWTDTGATPPAQRLTLAVPGL